MNAISAGSFIKYLLLGLLRMTRSCKISHLHTENHNNNPNNRYHNNYNKPNNPNKPNREVPSYSFPSSQRSQGNNPNNPNNPFDPVTKPRHDQPLSAASAVFDLNSLNAAGDDDQGLGGGFASLW